MNKEGLSNINHQRKTKHGKVVNLPKANKNKLKGKFKAKPKKKSEIRSVFVKSKNDSQLFPKDNQRSLTLPTNTLTMTRKKNKSVINNITLVSDENSNIPFVKTTLEDSVKTLDFEKVNLAKKSTVKSTIKPSAGSEEIIKPKCSNTSLADITHKKSTGNNNWTNFLRVQNPQYKPKGTSLVPLKESQSSTRKRKKRKLTKVVGLDCEMVGIGDQGRENMLARVSLVNSLGECIYDKFVQARENVIDYRTHVSGVRPEDMLKGEPFEEVQKEVADLIKNRIVVGHALKSDFDVLLISHPRRMKRDTSKYLREPGKGTPSLKKLALQFLGVKIQEGEHSSVQDARAAVQLYNMFREEWESKKRNHYSVNRDEKKSESNIL